MAQTSAPARPYDPRETPYLLGRAQGPKFHAHVPWTGAAPFQVRVQPNISIDKPIEGIRLCLTGRIAVTVANYVTVDAEALQSLLQRVIIEGTHKGSNISGRITLADMPGAWFFVLGRIFSPRGGTQIINGTRAAEPNIPFASPFLGTTAGSPYDFELHYYIPFAPSLPGDAAGRDSQLKFALRPERWNDDTLVLTLSFGDKSAVGDPTGSTVAFTAFGSGAGTPDCEVQVCYTIFGAADADVPERVLTRTIREVPTGVISALASRVQLAELDKERTMNILWKTGTGYAVARSSGVDGFQTLRDDMLENTVLMVGSTEYRKSYSTRNRVTKEYGGERFGTVWPGGYSGFTFADSLRTETYLRADQFGSGRFALQSDIVTAPAVAKAQILQERILIGDGPDRQLAWI